MTFTARELLKKLQQIPQERQKSVEQPIVTEIPEFIRMEETKRDFLQDKLVEYQGRLERLGHTDPVFIDAQYKISVLKELLQTGEVNSVILYSTKLSRIGLSDVQKFNNACLVIEGYLKGEVKNERGFMEPPKN